MKLISQIAQSQVADQQLKIAIVWSLEVKRCDKESVDRDRQVIQWVVKKNPVQLYSSSTGTAISTIAVLDHPYLPYLLWFYATPRSPAHLRFAVLLYWILFWTTHCAKQETTLQFKFFPAECHLPFYGFRYISIYNANKPGRIAYARSEKTIVTQTIMCTASSARLRAKNALLSISRFRGTISRSMTRNCARVQIYNQLPLKNRSA